MFDYHFFNISSAKSSIPILLLKLIINELYRYPGLTIKYVRGKDPIIKLLDEDDDVVEELAIDKWNTDSVEEFLSTYIEYQEEVNEESNPVP